MDSIRKLSHELNNALTALAGSIEMLRMSFRDGDTEQAAPLIQEASEACTRAVHLARQIGDESRGSETVESGPEESAESYAGDLRGRTILLCEDAESIRRSTRMILLSHGYRVLEAPSTDRARELADAHDGAIDLLVTDVELEDGDGRKLAAGLTNVRPQMRVLYVSGHAQESVALPAEAPEGSFLGKPFSSETLLRKVREILTT